MFDIVLFEPEIPQNTGSLIRLAANTGFHLHLIEPLGFEFEDSRLRRAGLDYHEWARVQRWPDLEHYQASRTGGRCFSFSAHASLIYAQASFEPGDSLIFGPETRGLPDEVVLNTPEAQRLRIPMQPQVRSLNLANAVSIVSYEAWRQNDFAGGV